MKGVYILLINVGKNLRLKIGSLGMINFVNGKYAYVGSAQNNLEKRVERHMSKNKKKFWHIDYLLGNKFTKNQSIYIKKDEIRGIKAEEDLVILGIQDRGRGETK